MTKNVNITLFTFLSSLLFHLPISVEFVLYVWQYWWSVKPKMKTGMKKKIQKVKTLWVQHFVYTQAYLFCDSTLAFSKESPCDRCKHIRLYCKLMHIDSCTDIVGERGWRSGIPITLENQIIKYWIYTVNLPKIDLSSPPPRKQTHSSDPPPKKKKRKSWIHACHWILL